MTTSQDRSFSAEYQVRSPRRRARPAVALALSWVAIALTGLLIAVFVFQLGTFESLKPHRPTTDAPRPQTDQITVSTSTITGFDKDDQPYSLKAETAAQDAVKPNLVHLKAVSAALKRATGEKLELNSATASYDTDTEVLQLDGNVKLVSVDRFVADMDKAQVTLRDKRLRSEVPVAVTFDRGTILAKGLEITDDGNRILFFNGVKATFRPAEEGSTKP